MTHTSRSGVLTAIDVKKRSKIYKTLKNVKNATNVKMYVNVE